MFLGVVKTDDSPPTSRLMSKLFPKLGVKPALFQQQVMFVVMKYFFDVATACNVLAICSFIVCVWQLLLLLLLVARLINRQHVVFDE